MQEPAWVWAEAVEGRQAGEYVTDEAAEAAATRARAKAGAAPLLRMDSKQRTVLARARASHAWLHFALQQCA